VIEQSKINQPALSPHRDSQKELHHTQHSSAKILSDKDSVGFIDLEQIDKLKDDIIDKLKDDISEKIEANQRSRAIVDVPRVPEQPKINFINNSLNILIFKQY
jgi:hypothetical protein